jgi:tetratricopeptide (TPR) repeat protein
VRLIILSHLQEGNFAGARQAASDLHSTAPDVCDELLAQVNREERDYQAEVTRLQRLVATTGDPEEAAAAQLWTAHAHQKAANATRALRSYAKLIGRREDIAKDSYATSAVRQCIGVMARAGQDVDRFCRSLLSTHADSYPICVAALSELAKRACAQGGMAAVSQEMARCRESAKEDPTVAATQIVLADMCLTHSQAEEAEGLLVQVKSTCPGTPAAQDARAMLAALYFERGRKEYAAGSYLAAAQHLETALEQEALGLWETRSATRTLGLCYQATDQTPRAIRYLEQALVLTPTGPSRIDILYQIAVCHFRAGDFAGAKEKFVAALAAEPIGPLSQYAKERVGQCDEMIAPLTGATDRAASLRPETGEEEVE